VDALRKAHWAATPERWARPVTQRAAGSHWLHCTESLPRNVLLRIGLRTNRNLQYWACHRAAQLTSVFQIDRRIQSISQEKCRRLNIWVS